MCTSLELPVAVPCLLWPCILNESFTPRTERISTLTASNRMFRQRDEVCVAGQLPRRRRDERVPNWVSFVVDLAIGLPSFLLLVS